MLVQDIERTLEYTGDISDFGDWKTKNYTTWVSFATRKFDQVEAGMSDRLLKLAQQSSNAAADDSHAHNMMETEDAAVSLEDLEDEEEDEIQVVTVKENKKKLVGARKHLVRGLKIGGVGTLCLRVCLAFNDGRSMLFSYA